VKLAMTRPTRGRVELMPLMCEATLTLERI
jgi:hypothetical protein